MGRLLDYLKTAGGEASLHSMLGRWRQKVSIAGDQAAVDINAVEADLNVAEVLIAALLAQNVIPDGTVKGQSLTWDEAAANEWSGSDISPLYVPTMDWTSSLGIVNTAAATGRVVHMGPGAWAADAAVGLESGAVVRGSNAVRIISTVPGASPFDCVWSTNTAMFGNNGTVAATPIKVGVSAVVSYGTAPPVITLTGVATMNVRAVLVRATLGGARGVWTGEWSVDGLIWVAFLSGAVVAMAGTGLSLNIAAGNANDDNDWHAQGPRSLSLTIAIAPTVGNGLEVKHNVSMRMFTVLAVFGAASPFTVILDRVMTEAFVIGDVAEELEPPTERVTIDGEGMVVSGIGNQTVEFARVWRPIIRDLNTDTVDGFPVNGGIGYDLGCWQGLVADCNLDFSGHTGSNIPALYLQSNEYTAIERCRFVGPPLGYGILVLDCYSSGMKDVHVSTQSVGILFGSLPLSPGNASLGSAECWADSCSAVGCDTGVKVQSGENTAISATSTLNCATNGFAVTTEADNPAPRGTRISNSAARNCGTGLLVNSNVLATRVAQFEAVGCGTGITLNADTELLGARIRGTSGTLALLIQAGIVRVSDLQIDHATAAGQGVTVTAGRTELTGANIACTGGGGAYGVIVNGGTAVLDGVVVTGGGGCTGLYVANGATVEITGRCDFSATAAPIVVAGGGFFKDRTAHAPVSTKLAADIVAPNVFTTILTVNINVDYGPNNLRVDASAAVSIAAADTYNQFRILVDGVDKIGGSIGATGLPECFAVNNLIMPATTPGAHTIVLQWAAPTAGASAIRAASQPDYEHAVLTVTEVASA